MDLIFFCCCLKYVFLVMVILMPVLLYGNIYTLDMCALATLHFPHQWFFPSSWPPPACPGRWVKVNKTPKYSVKHEQPLPCGCLLQRLSGNYGNNSAARARPEARGGRGQPWEAEPGRRGCWEVKAFAAPRRKASPSHQRPWGRRGLPIRSVRLCRQTADAGRGHVWAAWGIGPSRCLWL